VSLLVGDNVETCSSHPSWCFDNGVPFHKKIIDLEENTLQSTFPYTHLAIRHIFSVTVGHNKLAQFFIYWENGLYYYYVE
jgi:hypothetical protein